MRQGIRNCWIQDLQPSGLYAHLYLLFKRFLFIYLFETQGLMRGRGA